MDSVVVPGTFEVGGHVGRREGVLDGRLDLGGGVVSGLQGFALGKYEVDGYFMGVPKVAEARLVVSHPPRLRFGIQQGGERQIGFRVSFVHKAGEGRAHQTHTCPEDVERHEDATNGVEGQPLGGQYEPQSGEDGNSGPAIGEGVVTVGHQNIRVLLFSEPDEVFPEHPVDEYCSIWIPVIQFWMDASRI